VNPGEETPGGAESSKSKATNKEDEENKTKQYKTSQN
jgi:hypothetical protein